jgi:hypothetical protein
MKNEYSIRLRVASVALTLVIVLGVGVVTTQSVEAKTYTILYNFTGRRDGGQPLYGSLVQDSAGILYGTTEQWGRFPLRNRVQGGA